MLIDMFFYLLRLFPPISAILSDPFPKKGFAVLRPRKHACGSPSSRGADKDGLHPRAIQSLARFDFSWGDIVYHQETLENLKIAVKSTKKLCAVMLYTVGPELQVVNKSEHAISLEAEGFVTLTPDQEKVASSELLPINFSGLAKAGSHHHL